MVPLPTGRRKPEMKPSTKTAVLATAFLAAAFCAASSLLAPLPAGAAGSEDAASMTFKIVAAGPACPGCVVIDAKGEITDETARDFALFLAEGRLKGILPKEGRRNAPRGSRCPEGDHRLRIRRR